MFYRVGTLLDINGMSGQVIGYIVYENPQDACKAWTEYRIKTEKGGECWLSCDEVYDEYSISWPANDVKGRIGPEWHKVDEGIQVVRSAGGDVDVDPGERASFVEYEDASEDCTLSVEIWSDGTEFSTGKYIEKSDIVETGYAKPPARKVLDPLSTVILILAFGLPLCLCLISTISDNLALHKRISSYMKGSSQYVYETSISGNQKQKATVYAYQSSATTNDVAEDIIRGVNGNTESVTQKDYMPDAEIAILTDKEYCLIYHPEDEAQKVYVQVSDRKYNYTSDNAPYRISSAGTSWYRSHYYSAGYSKDSSSYKSTPSAYSMYNGTTLHDIGNGYFDSYSGSIRQASINSRSSSSGGGK